MTHADVIRAKRDAVVEAAKAETADEQQHNADGTWPPGSLECLAAQRIKRAELVKALIAAEALTCPACRGCGRISMQPAPGARGVLFGVCPACHGTGRKPDTFRDDGATTPEGCEDPDDRGGKVPGA